MSLSRRGTFLRGTSTKGDTVSPALAQATELWGPDLMRENQWRHVVIHCENRWIENLIRQMKCDSVDGQNQLRQCALSQAQNRLHFETHWDRASMGQNKHDRLQRIVHMASELKRASVAGSTLGQYRKNFRFWESFCNDFGFPVWIHELPKAQQARMVGLFAALCAMEGHNKHKRGNKFQTFDGKMAAVAFAHKAIQNGRLNYRDPEFELIAQGYKRTNSQVDRKQPVTTSMLLTLRQQLDTFIDTERLLWGSIVLGFFFLDRSSEHWGPVANDSSTGSEWVHCVKAHNVIIRNAQGKQISHQDPEAHSVEILYESHKGDRIGQGVTVRHYKSLHAKLCPVATALECLSVRTTLIRSGIQLGPYLTSTSKTKTIKKATVAQAIKSAAHQMGLPKKDYSAHSLRIGGACALLAAGKSDLVIRLMGRWSSWCFSVYTRL